MIDFSLLHFIRPWGWSLFPILLATGWWFTYNRAQTVEWKNYIDEHLASWLLDSARKQKKKSLLWPLLFLLSAFILSFSAAGPAWKKQPVATSSITSKAIIVLDLSPSMMAEDISPSRLGRAKFKVLEILKQWQQGYVGLVAFAEDGFVISPLTDDADTIANMVNVLSPAIMPGRGAAADSGIRMALDLLEESENLQISGDILLITDGVSAARTNSIQRMLDDTSVRLSVLTIGTKQGAPIQSQESAGFVTDSSGAIVIAKLDNAPLIKLALSFDGLFLSSKASNEDILSWLDLLKSDFDNKNTKIEENKVERWVDQGALFLLPILLLMAFIFRKGLLFSFLIFSLYLPNDNLYAAANEANATPTKKSEDLPIIEDSLWDNLWYNNEQLGDRKMQAEHPELALQNYTQPKKIAEALYRAGLYQQAAEIYASLSGADARYNQGNALAQNKKLKDAIKSYQKALELEPDFAEAKKNLKTVEELLKKQQEQKNKNDQNNKKDKDKNSKDKKDDKDKKNDQKDSEKDKNDQKNQDQPQDSQQDDENKEADEKPPEQQQDEKQQAKQQKNKQQQKKPQKELTPEEKQAEKQKQQMIEQWLRQIKDDPSRLLRNKLILEQRRREQSGNRPEQDNKEW